MERTDKYFEDQLVAYIENKLPQANLGELFEWIDSNGEHYTNMLSSGHIQQLIISQADRIPVSQQLSMTMKNRLLKEIKSQNQPQFYPTVHRVHFLKRAWFKYAAILVVAFGIGAYLWTSNKKIDQPQSATNTQLIADILPGSNKAVLTLLDGTRIELDNKSNGQVAQQGNVSIIKLADRRIAYKLNGSAEGEVMMNTMSTPKGGQYELALPDGSKAWLNAASSIQFPAAFTGKTRTVKITGEVYFEIAKNKEKPFVVDVDGKSLVQVLGTSFNVNSYADEAAVKTTLITGSVRVSTAATSATLKPGQQAQINRIPEVANAEKQVQVINANIEQTLAWKNGIFNFNGLDVRTVMAQLSRWYDIEVRYDGPIPSKIFKGEMYRDVKLSAVLQWLRDTGVKFKMDGKTLIIMQ